MGDILSILLFLLGLYVVYKAIFDSRNFRRSISSGLLGEKRVAKTLKKLPKKHFRVYHDVLVSTELGTSQIDHVIISVYGIFVIETKNYKGWIFGHEKAEFWTQTLFKDKVKFRNPLKQNWGHVKAL